MGHDQKPDHSVVRGSPAEGAHREGLDLVGAAREAERVVGHVEVDRLSAGHRERLPEQRGVRLARVPSVVPADFGGRQSGVASRSGRNVPELVRHQKLDFRLRTGVCACYIQRTRLSQRIISHIHYKHISTMKIIVFNAHRIQEMLDAVLSIEKKYFYMRRQSRKFTIRKCNAEISTCIFQQSTVSHTFCPHLSLRSAFNQNTSIVLHSA